MPKILKAVFSVVNLALKHWHEVGLGEVNFHYFPSKQKNKNIFPEYHQKGKESKKKFDPDYPLKCLISKIINSCKNSLCSHGSNILRLIVVLWLRHNFNFTIFCSPIPVCVMQHVYRKRSTNEDRKIQSLAVPGGEKGQ